MNPHHMAAEPSFPVINTSVQITCISVHNAKKLPWRYATDYEPQKKARIFPQHESGNWLLERETVRPSISVMCNVQALRHIWLFICSVLMWLCDFLYDFLFIYLFIVYLHKDFGINSFGIIFLQIFMYSCLRLYNTHKLYLNHEWTVLFALPTTASNSKSVRVGTEWPYHFSSFTATTKHMISEIITVLCFFTYNNCYIVL